MKLKRVKILDFIISGCIILYIKISRMVIFRLVFLIYFLKLSVGNGLSKFINFLFPLKNHQKTHVFQMISRGIEIY